MKIFKINYITSLSFFLFAACTSNTKKTVHIPSELTIIPQWHLSPNTQTTNSFSSSSKLPQYQNQQEIFIKVSELIKNKQINNLIIEGCEGDLENNQNVKFNGWSLVDLKKELQTQKSIDPIITNVGFKLYAANENMIIENHIEVKCGDNIDLLKKNQLSLSEIRGLMGFKIRINDSKLNKIDKEKYLVTIKQLLSLPANTSLNELNSTIDLKINSEYENFKSLLEQRNESFLKMIQKMNGKTVLVIGALHVDGIKNSISKQPIQTSIWWPEGINKADLELLEVLSRKLKKNL